MNVSIVICTYNEEGTISNVIQSCCSHNPSAQIIIVDDGSTDETESIVNKLRTALAFDYIRLDSNKGKSWAMATGVKYARNEIILFFDADVSNISKNHFDLLLQPIIEEKADMVLGQPSETLINYRVNPFKSLTGERVVLKKDILPILDDIKEIRFGVETFINLYYQAHGKKLKYVLLSGLTHPNKYEKTTPQKATKEFIKEGREIGITLLQNYDLITKRVNNSFERNGTKMLKSIKKFHGDANNKFHALMKNNG
jgi:glycosyltransferase involved in cell wall biosynthesis